ncbi:glycoside hydrolase family 19 protein [Laspinema olomoucense]|uniref:Chitinase n=1 Tax=Laspinema olomoucense D3b TaxID=2953688 RepID=A0ABT2NES4_9CYAN|nr:hypothetical protein [Laspinema sp. D3b]MCT7979835.1 hypothetical protein [Laspinema sp. D3b]
MKAQSTMRSKKPMKTITAKVQTQLKKKPVKDSQLQPHEILAVAPGKTYGVEKIEPGENGYSKVTLAANSGTFYVVNQDWDGLSGGKTLITKAQAQAIFANSIYDEELKDLNACLEKYQISTPARMRHFISQLAHESGGLKWLKELADGWDYEGRSDLGNVCSGDGPKYKGSGALQLTGRSNYQDFCNEIGDPRIMGGCDYVAKNYPFTSAGFWWKNNNMNQLCDRGATVAEVTRRVNGGYNGLEDREYYYQQACKFIQ